MKSTGPFVTQPGFDAMHMYETYGDDAAIVKEILQEYLHELPVELGLMQQHFEHRHYDELMGSLHKLKPGFLYVGLQDLYHKVAELEVACRAGEQNTVLQNQFPALMQEISQSQFVIAQVVDSLGNA